MTLVVAQLELAIYCSSSVHMDGENVKTKISVGPWGGNGGTSWDDGCYQGVREIKIVYDRCIDSICVIYEKNGRAVRGDKHGGVGGSKTAEIKLNFPEEYLVSVTGHYFPVVYGGQPVVKSLLFKTNKRSFGPFGVEEGTPFSFPMDGGKIVGFKGRSGWYLDAIGFHLQRVQSTKMTKKLQQWLQRSMGPKSTRENTRAHKSSS